MLQSSVQRIDAWTAAGSLHGAAQHNGTFNSARIEYLAGIVKETQYPTNRYAFAADASAPYGIVLVAPIFKEEDADTLQKELQA